MHLAAAPPISPQVDGSSPIPVSGLEYSISLGNLLTVGSFLVFATMYVVNLRSAAKLLAAKLQIIDNALGAFKEEMKRLTEVIVEQARMDGRINMTEQRLLQEGKRIDEMAASLDQFKNTVIADMANHKPKFGS